MQYTIQANFDNGMYVVRFKNNVLHNLPIVMKTQYGRNTLIVDCENGLSLSQDDIFQVLIKPNITKDSTMLLTVSRDYEIVRMEVPNVNNADLFWHSARLALSDARWEEQGKCLKQLASMN